MAELDSRLAQDLRLSTRELIALFDTSCRRRFLDLETEARIDVLLADVLAKLKQVQSPALDRFVPGIQRPAMRFSIFGLRITIAVEREKNLLNFLHDKSTHTAKPPTRAGQDALREEYELLRIQMSDKEARRWLALGYSHDIINAGILYTGCRPCTWTPQSYGDTVGVLKLDYVARAATNQPDNLVITPDGRVLIQTVPRPTVSTTP